MEMKQIGKKDIVLTNTEYKNLTTKISGGYSPVDYFRRNLFNADCKSSGELKRYKTIYDDDKMILKVNRSLHQRHRDLLSLLTYYECSKPKKDGSYYIKTNLYEISKQMGYSKSTGNTIIKSLLDDMRSTTIVKQYKGQSVKHGFMLLGDFYHDEDNGSYIVEVRSETSSYIIQSTCVQIPHEVNQRLVLIPNKLSKLKALISYLLSNKRLKNGIFFDTICEKLVIISPSVKSKFKKLVKDNVKLLEKFKIIYQNDKFFIEEQLTSFERAVTKKNVETHKYRLFVNDLKKRYEGKKLYIFNDIIYTFKKGFIHYLKGELHYENEYKKLGIKDSKILLQKFYDGELYPIVENSLFDDCTSKSNRSTLWQNIYKSFAKDAYIFLEDRKIYNNSHQFEIVSKFINYTIDKDKKSGDLFSAFKEYFTVGMSNNWFSKYL